MYRKQSKGESPDSVGFRVIVDLENGWRLKVGPLLSSDQACQLVLHVRELLKHPKTPAEWRGKRPIVVSDTVPEIEEKAA